jgi:hypothetical protein
MREPRSIICEQDFSELTVPLVEPVTDIFQELFQFSHLTFGFAGRTFLAGCLLAYGLIQQQILLIVAGLLFLPILPLLLSIGFGVWTKKWKLAGQGSLSFVTVSLVLILGGVLVAALSHPPLRYNDFNSPLVSVLISAAVGIAAGLSTIDDVGRRELIGLAASSQLAVIPSWLGICLVFGFPETTGQNEIYQRLGSFFLNAGTIIVMALAVYILTCGANASFNKLRSKSPEKANRRKDFSERAALR